MCEYLLPKVTALDTPLFIWRGKLLSVSPEFSLLTLFDSKDTQIFWKVHTLYHKTHCSNSAPPYRRRIPNLKGSYSLSPLLFSSSWLENSLRVTETEV